MPLLPGKKNIGHNIKTEESHGKPYKQALAIALHTAGVPEAKRPKGQNSMAKYVKKPEGPHPLKLKAFRGK